MSRAESKPRPARGLSKEHTLTTAALGALVAEPTNEIGRFVSRGAGRATVTIHPVDGEPYEVIVVDS